MKFKSYFAFNTAIIILLVFALSLVSGCALFHNPFKAWTKAETKVEVVQSKLETNQDQTISEGRKYVYGTKLALASDTSTNQAHQVATELNDKAVATLGPPTIQDINALQVMINNLLSTNKAIIIKGEKELADLDAKVVSLQSEKANLEAKLDAANQTLTKVGTANAGLAEKWHKLTSWFWYIVIGFGVIFVLRIVAAVCPPPYNSVIQVIAIPFTWVIHAIQAFIPEAIAAAGWVEKEYKVATQDLVNVIDSLKTSNPALHPTISATVASTVSDTAVGVINAAKTSQKIVS